MNATISFHEVRFPTDLALGSTGGPVRRTEVITLGSGKEQRNARWVHSRRRYNAGYGIKTIENLQTVVAFFEERRGRLFGFRFKDPLDWKSSSYSKQISAFDQKIGIGDGSNKTFQLLKHYGSEETGYSRQIVKPVEGSVLIGLDGNNVASSDYTIDHKSGIVEFNSDKIPPVNSVITVGYEFDIPVRFDIDEISINLSHFEVGDIPAVPLVELLL